MGGSVFKSSAEKLEYLKVTPFFLTFDEEELEECANYFSVKKVKPGQFVKDYAFIVVVDGLLSISTLVPRDKASSKHPTTHTAESHVVERLCVKKTGDFFSKASQEVNIENSNKIARAYDFTTVKALKDSTLLILNKRKSKDYMKNNSRHARILHEVLSIDFGKLLEPVPFLSGVSRQKLTMLAEMFSFESFSEGDVVVREGDFTSQGKFYVVLSGKFSVFADPNKLKLHANDIVGTQNSEDKLELAQIETGSYFGEMSLLCNMPRTATVVARGKCLLASLDADQFRVFEKLEHSVKDAINLHAKERMMNRLCCFQIPFFAGISMDKLVELSHTSIIAQFSAGEAVIKEGTKSEVFYIVVHGELDVLKESQGNVPIASLSVGSYFAEISLVTNMPHHATVVAKTDCVLLTISMEGFRKLSKNNPELLVEFEMRVVGRQGIKLRHVLHHSLGMELFKEHLASEYSDESVKFWEAVNNFKSLIRKGSQDQANQAAKEIVDTFIVRGAPTQINVSDQQHTAILDNIEAKPNVTIELFQEAEQEIFKLMERDNFQRFTTTPLFEKLVNAVCIYTTEQLRGINKEEKRRRSLLLTMVSDARLTRSQRSSRMPNITDSSEGEEEEKKSEE